LKEGDLIEIDIPNRTLNADVSDEEFSERRKEWKKPAPKKTSGWLARYASLATNASTGAVLQSPCA
jgi:dihydroxy-acid dehydratase